MIGSLPPKRAPSQSSDQPRGAEFIRLVALLAYIDSFACLTEFTARSANRQINNDNLFRILDDFCARSVLVLTYTGPRASIRLIISDSGTRARRSG